MRPLQPGESLTPGGFIRRADGVVELPPEGHALHQGWIAAGSIVGLTMAEIVQRVGFNADAVPAKQYTNGYTHTWTRPGYTVSVLFGPDNRAKCIVAGSELIGMPPPATSGQAPAQAPPRQIGNLRALLTGVAVVAIVAIALTLISTHSGKAKTDAVQRMCSHAFAGESYTRLDPYQRYKAADIAEGPDPATWGGNGQFLFSDGVTMTFSSFKLVASNCGEVNGRPVGGI